jgi:hypothetical protein
MIGGLLMHLTSTSHMPFVSGRNALVPNLDGAGW